MASLQDVFVQHFAQYAGQRSLHPRESVAASCIARCYTRANGSHWMACPNGHVLREQFHACRHRSCPRCADGPRQQWLSAELLRLLPCPHFHVVFTLPHELLALWEFNRKAFAQVLFDCVRETLLELLADPRFLGATPGMLLSLHTWGRNLSRHPHIHVLLSAGGLNAAGAWVPTRSEYLLPLAVLRALFRGKLLGVLTQHVQSGAWAIPPRSGTEHWCGVIKRLYRKHWNIQINPPYQHGRGVAMYLARYAKGGPLPKSRPLHCTDDRVSFSYTDHRDQRAKRIALSPSEFIARVLWHAPPKHCHTVRHAGLYARAAHVKNARAAIALAAAEVCAAASGKSPPAQAAPYIQPVAPPTTACTAPRHARAELCQHCHCPLQRIHLGARNPRRQISLSPTTHPHASPHHRGARPNWAFKLTSYGMAAGPPGDHLHSPPGGPAAMP